MLNIAIQFTNVASKKMTMYNKYVSKNVVHGNSVHFLTALFSQ